MIEDIGSDLRKSLRLWRSIVDIENAQENDVSPKTRFIFDKQQKKTFIMDEFRNF